MPKAKDFLKPGVTFEHLATIAAATSDNEAARMRLSCFALAVAGIIATLRIAFTG